MKWKVKKLKEERYWEEFNKVLEGPAKGDPAEAESIMWNRRLGWNDYGDKYLGKNPQIRLIKGVK